jgi:DDE superfamily endonuclease
MFLWLLWWSNVQQLRSAFSRKRTFLWFALCVAGMTVRKDLAGVSSIVRSLGLHEYFYDRLLDCFHSSAITLDRLTVLWVGLIRRCCAEFLLTVNGRLVILGDGIKAPKAGKRMPAVKRLHQESGSNTKPEYIFGHSCQAVALVAGALETFFAIPLSCRIHEGVVFSNRDKRTLLDKMVELLMALLLEVPCYFVADAYYANKTIIRKLLKSGLYQLVTRARSNAVAYYPAVPSKVIRRGRKRKYGKKISLKSLFDNVHKFTEAPSPVYGEKEIVLSYRSIDLFWRPVGILVRFVLVIHPQRGRLILMSTDLCLSAEQIIELYGIRFKIEVTFKQAIHTVGTYAYHFWMAEMTRLSRKSGNQHLHQKTEDYRNKVKRKINAYHAHIMAGVVAQGMLQYLSLAHADKVWKSFGSWIRTIRPGVLPSEQVVAVAMRNVMPEFLAVSDQEQILAQFIREKIDVERAEGLALVA